MQDNGAERWTGGSAPNPLVNTHYLPVPRIFLPEISQAAAAVLMLDSP